MKKYSELSLSEKVAFFESVLESMSDMVLVKGENSRLLWANKPFRECYGLTQGELQGLLDATHSNPDHTLQYVQDDKFVFENNRTLNIPSEPVTSHDGLVKYCHTIKSPITDKSGEVVMTVGLSRLISNEEQIAELEESRWATTDLSNQLSHFVSSLPSCVALVDMNLRYVCVSDRWKELFSLTKGFENSPVLPSLPARDEHWSKVFEMCLAGESYGESGIPLSINNDKDEIVNWQIVPWKDQNDRIRGLVLTLEIVTELHKQRSLLDRTQRLAKVGGWELDVPRNSLWWSEEVFRIHEVKLNKQPSVEEAINFYAPEAKDAISEAIRAGIEDQLPMDLELPLITAKGNRIWVRAQGEPIVSSGRTIRLVGSFQDITTRYLAEKAAPLEKDRFELALKSGDLGLWDWNITSGEAYFDARWFSMLGYEPGELESNFDTWRSLIHPDDLEATTEKLTDYLEGRSREYLTEIRMRTKRGSWKWINTRGMIVDRDHNGYPTRAVGTHLDVTDSKRAQVALLNAKEAAEEANRTKSQFLANMSHEIRTPMNGVLGMAQLLLESNLSKENSEIADTLFQSANSLLGIVDDILDFSKIGVKKLELCREPFLPQEIAESVKRMFASRMREKDLQFHLEHNLKSSEIVLGDPSRLRQILVNLVGNALKFTKPAGSVTLKLNREIVSREQLLVNFSVSDTGIGINPNKLSEIFEAFAQGDSGVTRQYGGTGLGLTISSQLVDLMGGRLNVDSIEGKGSTFSFTLRFEIGELSEQPHELPASAVKLPSTSLSILVAEDNKINQNVAKKLLEREGHIVTIVSNGQEAVEATRSESFDVVLMDIQMPIMGGVEAARIIRENMEIPPVPIIALTAHAMQGDRDKYLSEGLDEYVSKPFSKMELLLAIARAIESSKR